MQTTLPPIARDILHALLDQHEQPQRQQVRRIRLTRQHYPAYFTDTNATPRQHTNAALQQLADEGVLRLRWRKWETGNWLNAVDLVTERAKTLYTLLRRTPHHEREQALLTLLNQQTPRGDWHTAFLSWVQEQLSTHRSVAPLDMDDPQKNADLLRLLDALTTLQTLTMERTVSTRLFGNSKRLDALRPAVLTVLRRHTADAATLYGNDDAALLRAYQLERIPEYIPLAGPLVLHTPMPVASAVTDVRAISGEDIVSRKGAKTQGSDKGPDSLYTSPVEQGTTSASAVLDICPFTGGLALPASTLREANIAACDAQALITIENSTSFHEMLATRPASFLVICTLGFASPSLIALLEKIRHARPDLPVLHWGDLDPGGLRILRHLRSRLDRVIPLAMDCQTFDTHCTMAQPLTKNDQAALEQLQDVAELADCASMIARLREAGTKLEQESVAAEDVVRGLGFVG